MGTSVSVACRYLENSIILSIFVPLLFDTDIPMKLIYILLSITGAGLFFQIPVLMYIHSNIMETSGMYVRELKESVSFKQFLKQKSAIPICHVENYVVLNKELDVPNEHGELLTTCAAQYNHKDAMDIFLHAGLDMNQADSRGYTPLILCIILDHYELAKMLLEYRHETISSC